MDQITANGVFNVISRFKRRTSFLCNAFESVLQRLGRRIQGRRKICQKSMLLSGLFWFLLFFGDPQIDQWPQKPAHTKISPCSVFFQDNFQLCCFWNSEKWQGSFFGYYVYTCHHTFNRFKIAYKLDLKMAFVLISWSLQERFRVFICLSSFVVRLRENTAKSADSLSHCCLTCNSWNQASSLKNHLDISATPFICARHPKNFFQEVL